jgi:hypothetical protein
MTGFIAQIRNLLLHLTNTIPHTMFSLQPPPQETPSIQFSDPRYIASGRPQKKSPFPNNSSIVIEMCLHHCCIETVVLLLLRVCSFPREPVYPAVA